FTQRLWHQDARCYRCPKSRPFNRWATWPHNARPLRLRAAVENCGRLVGNCSRKPLPQTLTEGLPMIPPEAVDICRPMMVRYSVIYRVTRCDRSRLSQDCTEPGGSGRVLPRRIAGFSCRRPENCFAGLASRGVRKSNAYAGAAGGVCGGGARDFPADSWRLGKDGTHAYSPGGGERGCTDGCTPNGGETGN